MTSARTAPAAIAPVAASTPDGTSAATTSADELLMASIAPATGSRGAPLKPVPSIASTTTSKPSPASRSTENATGASPSSRSRIAAASPESFAGSLVHATTTRRPAPRSSRAAA